MTLDELARSQVGDALAFGRSLDDAGPAARMLTERVRSENVTRTLVANAFWQAYLKTDVFARVVRELDLEVGRTEPVVLRHDPVFPLLLEQPEWEAWRDPVTIVAEATRSDLERGWAEAMEARVRLWEESGRRTRDPRRVQEALQLGPALAAEAADAVPFQMILTPATPTELTSAPQPPAGVGATTADATVGAAVRDHAGRIGVTAAAHALAPGGTAVVEQGSLRLTGTIASYEAAYTDSCFVVLDRDPAGRHPLTLRPTQGPLKLAPRLNSPGTFDGWVTPSSQAVVKAANWELPYIDPYLQQTVRTDPVTARGDSGAALLDSADYIIGFAYSRNTQATLPTHVRYSAWIWADAVFDRHGLVPY